MNKRAIILVVFLVIGNTAFAEGEFKLGEEFVPFSFDELFKTLPLYVEKLKIYFYSIAFIIFIIALYRMLKSAREVESQIGSIVKISVAIAVMVSCKYFLNLALDFNEGLSKVLGTDYYAMSNKLYNLAHSFYAADFTLGAEEALSNGHNEVLKGGLEDQLARTGFFEKMGNWFTEKVDATKEFLSNPLGGLYYIGIRFSFVIASGLFAALIYFCSFLIVLMDSIRYFLINISMLLLPICIAGLFTQVFRSQSIAYIFSVISNILWPLGWALGNMGTEAMLKSFIDYCKTGLGLKNAHELLSLDMSKDPYTVSAEFIRAMMSLPFLELVLVWFFISLIAIWTIIVTLCGPRVIKKFIQTGADFFDTLTEGTTRFAGAAVGNIVSGVALGGAHLAAAGISKMGTGARAISGGVSTAASLVSSTSGSIPSSSGFDNVVGKMASGLMRGTDYGAAGLYAVGKLTSQAARVHWDPNNTVNMFDAYKFISDYKNRMNK